MKLRTRKKNFNDEKMQKSKNQHIVPNKKRILRTTIKREWFIKIVKQEKKIEEREIKPYWTKRLAFHYDEIELRNGYQRFSPLVRAELDLVDIGEAQDLILRDSNNLKKEVYRLHIGKILEVRA